MTDFNQPCGDGFGVTDGIGKSVTVNLEDCRVPGGSLYPSNSLYPGHIIGISDIGIKTLTKFETENWSVVDSPVKTYVKNTSEGGLQPSGTLYPSLILYPYSGILVFDKIVKTPCKNVADNSTVSDTINSFAVVKGVSDNIGFLEGFANEITKYLNENSNFIDSSIYNTGKNLSETATVNDVFEILFTSYFTESVGILDETAKFIVKYLQEYGLIPYDTLYSSEILYPDGAILVVDNFNFGFTNNLSDNFSIIDDIIRAIIKDIPDDINISDKILFNTILYLEENSNILDEISKCGYKSLTDQAAFIDGVTKNIISILSDDIDIDDEIETILRTLVRATLEAIDDGNTTLSAIKSRISNLGLA